MKKYLAVLLCFAMLITSALSPFDLSLIKAEAVETTSFHADKVLQSPDMDKPISEDTWGEPTLSIDKNSYNTGLTKYNAEPEDVTADLYFRWDEEYLYIGVKSPDADVTGTGDYWTGDGIQFKLQAGEALTSEASDICLTWGSGTFGVGGGNEEVLENSIQHNILSEDGSLSMMLAIPHSDMGYSEEEVKSGATYAIGLLRISGQGGDSASDAQAYSGWLEWGDFWGASHDLHNANCISPNTIVLDEETAPNVVKAGRALGAPIMDKPISEDTWGEPTLSIDKNSYNTGLTEYNAEPEDVTADLYFRWDEEYLYIGVKSPDADVTGTGDYWTGDGIQFKLQAGETLTSEATDICLTWGSGTFGVGGGNEEVLENSIQHNILSEDGSLSMMLAIPHSDMGYSEEEVKSGATYAIGLLRISGREEKEPRRPRHTVAGWSGATSGELPMICTTPTVSAPTPSFWMKKWLLLQHL